MLSNVDKNGYSCRPIVNTINSPTYQLAKFLPTPLSKSTGHTKYITRNGWEFAKFIEDFQVPIHQKIVPFHVVSMSTSIPVKVAIV